MRKYLPVVSLIALGALPGCIFVADSTSHDDDSRVARLEKRLAKLEETMEECGEECCNDKEEHEHEAPKAQAEAHETPKPAGGKS
jgi:hypothetical protein